MQTQSTRLLTVYLSGLTLLRRAGNRSSADGSRRTTCPIGRATLRRIAKTYGVEYDTDAVRRRSACQCGFSARGTENGEDIRAGGRALEKQALEEVSFTCFQGSREIGVQFLALQVIRRFHARL
jgi:hypothetical protein